MPSNALRLDQRRTYTTGTPLGRRFDHLNYDAEAHSARCDEADANCPRLSQAWAASLVFYDDAVPTVIGQGFRGPDGRIGYLLRQAQHALWLALEDALRPLGLSAAGFAVLRLVEVEPGTSGADLAAGSMYRPQAIQELLVSLEAAGFIERRVDLTDRRRRLSYVTPNGAEVLAQSHVWAIKLEEMMMSGLAEDERRLFKTWLVDAAVALTEGGPRDGGAATSRTLARDRPADKADK